MNPRGFWLLMILFFGVAGNPGADDPNPRPLDVHGDIQCSTYKKIGDSDEPGEGEHHLVLAAREGTSIRRKLVVDDEVELEMKCFWKGEVYRCEWSDYYYLEFYVDNSWSPLSRGGNSSWVLFRGEWQKGPLTEGPVAVHCGQRK